MLITGLPDCIHSPTVTCTSGHHCHMMGLMNSISLLDYLQSLNVQLKNICEERVKDKSHEKLMHVWDNRVISWGFSGFEGRWLPLLSTADREYTFTFTTFVLVSAMILNALRNIISRISTLYTILLHNKLVSCINQSWHGWCLAP